MKKALKLGVLLLALVGAVYVWWVHFNYRFAAITEGKVYKSGQIPPEKIAGFIADHGIKTVIDLRHPGLKDKLNPADQEAIDKEREAVAKIGGVRHVNIPSGQVPDRASLSKFFEVLDDNSSYPVLIHCYHGTGRAMIYSAIYRIEYEKFTNEAARGKTRFILYKSSFDKGRSKGDFLINYKPRREGEKSTLNTLER
jgi:protein tyrosine phosphatase (PTP) superfamily phosphohydrolase (DUF442 family)